MSSKRFLEAYFRILHHPLEQDGVDFWWIDWQQGTASAKDGLDPLWALNHYHYLAHAARHRHPLIMSRYAGIGSHRYPIGFSGDTTISWATLRLMPYFTATAANCGYSWWSHDIGGHHLGEKDDELYLRFLQFGVFNPINRMHCTDSPMLTKEPWAYENGIGQLAADALRLGDRLCVSGGYRKREFLRRQNGQHRHRRLGTDAGNRDEKLESRELLQRIEAEQLDRFLPDVKISIKAYRFSEPR